jgi:hypothetical protein
MLLHPFRMVIGMNQFSSDHTADPMASVHRHPSYGRWAQSNMSADRPSANCSSLGSSAFAVNNGDDLDAELRLLEAIARRGPEVVPQRRTVTIAARGSLRDGRILWSGADGTWGVIEPLLAEMMGWNASSSRSVRADVYSANNRHQVLEVRTLVVV